jgi:hypothetical protein
MDPISLAVGAALLAAGWLSGRVTRRRPPAAAAPSGPTCGCGHSLALHDRQEGIRNGEVRREHYWDDGSRNGYEWVECTCRQYTGELPVDITSLGLPGYPADLKEKQ